MNRKALSRRDTAHSACADPEKRPGRPHIFLFRLWRLAVRTCGLRSSHAVQGSSAVRAGLRTQEDGHSRGALQTGQRPHQGEWAAPGDDRTPHATIQAAGTCSASGQGAICWGGHPSPSEGWWSRGPDLCYPPIHLQSPGGLLPEIRG